MATTQDEPDLTNLRNQEFLAWITRRYRITPLQAAVGVFLFNLLTGLIMAQWANAWGATQVARGASSDLPTWMFELLLHPLVFAYFVWLQSAAAKLFKPILGRDFGVPKSHISSCIYRSSLQLKSTRLVRFATVVGVAGATITAIVFLNPELFSNKSWLTIHPLMAWVRAFSYGLVVYALVLVIGDSAVLIVTLGKMLERSDFVYYPLDPDNGGGLSSVGRFSANYAYIGAAAGIVLTVTILHDPDNLIRMRDYVLFVYIVLYFAIVPLLFVAPLWRTHLSMKRYRNSVLGVISMENNARLNQITSADDTDRKDVFADFDRIVEIEKAHETVKKYPTWPFDTVSLRKFIGLTVAPLTPLFGAVLQYLWSLIV